MGGISWTKKNTAAGCGSLNGNISPFWPDENVQYVTSGPPFGNFTANAWLPLGTHLTGNGYGGGCLESCWKKAGTPSGETGISSLMPHIPIPQNESAWFSNLKTPS